MKIGVEPVRAGVLASSNRVHTSTEIPGGCPGARPITRENLESAHASRIDWNEGMNKSEFRTLPSSASRPQPARASTLTTPRPGNGLSRRGCPGASPDMLSIDEHPLLVPRGRSRLSVPRSARRLGLTRVADRAPGSGGPGAGAAQRGAARGRARPAALRRLQAHGTGQAVQRVPGASRRGGQAGLDQRGRRLLQCGFVPLGPADQRGRPGPGPGSLAHRQSRSRARATSSTAPGQEIDCSGLLCLFDAEGPCANAVKDSQRTKTHPGTRATLSVVWGVKGWEQHLERTVAWYRELLERAGAQTD